MKITVIGYSLEDIILSCGGMLIKNIRNGEKVNLIIVNSKIFVYKNHAIQELEKKFRIKINNIENFNCSVVTQNNVKLIQGIFEENNPDTIIIPFNKSRIKRNKILGSSCILAGRQIKNILMYELNKNINFSPTIFQEIEKVIKQKRELIASLDKSRKNELEEKIDDINKKNKKYGLKINFFEPLQSFRMVLN